jgi:carotenoid cleavage dioxygenase-like enzyme
MTSLGHPKIKTSNGKMTFFKPSQNMSTYLKGIEFKDINARLNTLTTHFPQLIMAHGFQ